ncbi:hypothetical protein ES705_31558 [subsurface metagenome]
MRIVKWFAPILCFLFAFTLFAEEIFPLLSGAEVTLKVDLIDELKSCYSKESF